MDSGTSSPVTAAGESTGAARAEAKVGGCCTGGGDIMLQPRPRLEGDAGAAAASECAAGLGGARSASPTFRRSSSVEKSRKSSRSRVSKKHASMAQQVGALGVRAPEAGGGGDKYDDDGPKPGREVRGTAEDDGSVRGNDPTTTCSVCNKSFPSRKSLYGHMRCHPEREWRGINPPPGANIRTSPSSSSPASGPCDVPDMTVPMSDDPLLPAWSITQKRGRKATKSHSPARSSILEDNDEDPMVVAVSSLLRIAKGCLAHSPRVEPQLVVLVEMTQEEESVSGDGQRASSEPADADPEPEGPATREPEKRPDASNGHVPEELDPDVVSENYKCSKRKVKELGTLHDPGAPAVGNRRYKCNNCNESFSTYQALGGHKASHRKERSPPEKETTDEGAKSAGSARPPPNKKPLSSAPPPVAQKPSVLSEHRCDKCDMSFPTGQALGGHKRKHWNGHHESSVAAAPAKRNAELSTLRDFDLNKRPEDAPEEEEF